MSRERVSVMGQNFSSSTGAGNGRFGRDRIAVRRKTNLYILWSSAPMTEREKTHNSLLWKEVLSN
jgi:hypothetical protein